MIKEIAKESIMLIRFMWDDLNLLGKLVMWPTLLIVTPVIVLIMAVTYKRK
jgi:hypothetical protein